MEAEFIPLLVSFGYDQLTNYVKNKHLSIAVRREEEREREREGGLFQIYMQNFQLT